MLAAALTSGLASEGVDVVDLGVLPTPAVAHLAGLDGVPAAMVSASHNPFPDNGIKLFAAGGRKLTDDAEARIEVLLRAPASNPAPTGADIGTVSTGGDVGRYAEHVVAAIDGRSLVGVSLVLDCANGAASHIAPEVLSSLGASVRAVAASPDGVNINADCGSTHIDRLAAQVAASGADCGIALDGDADRCLAVDATGTVIDGDQLLAILALDLRSRSMLVDDTVVVTVYSNLGFHQAMQEHGINVLTTPTGDRYVLDALDAGGLTLGGEQSGHVIQRHLASTGDGLLTAICVLDALRRAGTTLSEAAAVVRRLPQVLLNVRVGGRDRVSLEGVDTVWREVAAVEAELGQSGRVLLRTSGTEPLVRVMVEAPTDDAAHAQAKRLAAVVEAAYA
jgi:phosphoglucosamine mutase